MKERYPDLYERITEKIADGSVRADREHVGRARLQHPVRRVARPPDRARQALLPRRVRHRDDATCGSPTCSGTPPRSRRSCGSAGVDWFLTQKLSWNQYDDLPHHSFWWEGIDGTRVFTHFPPAETYNGDGSVEQLRFGVENFRDHGRAEPLPLPVRLRRRRWRAHRGDPRVAAPHARPRRRSRRSSSTGPRAFFEAAEHESDDWAVWVGELYLECHRGTYTTPGRDEARQPAGRGGVARRPSCGRSRPGRRRATRPATRPRSSTTRGRCCCSTSSTTSSRARASTGSTRTRARDHAHRR